MDNIDSDWFGPDAATFGDRVAGAREAMGMSQGELARRLGVKKETVIGWEDDVAEPRANRLSMMAGLLNVSIMWLLTGEGEGMDAPSDEETSESDLLALLGELRAIRGQMRTLTEQAAKLEKNLRKLVERDQ